MVLKGDELSLWENSGTNYQLIKQASLAKSIRYLGLKQICHVAVLITMLIDDYLNQRNDQSLSQLNSISASLQSLLARAHHIFDQLDLERQRFIIKESVDVIKGLTSNSHKLAWLEIKKGYLDKITVALEKNSECATQTQLSLLDDLITEWGLKSSDLTKSRTIIISPHGPKPKRIEAQYFNRLYQTMVEEDSVEDNLLYHLEMLPSQIASLDVQEDIIKGFLAGAELNKSIGLNHLGSRQAMFSDILDKYAVPVLDKLFQPNDLQLRASM